MKYQSLNPYTGELLKEFPLHSFPDLILSKDALRKWSRLTIEDRCTHLKKLAIVLDRNKEQYARLITLEMGKPYKESLYEISKVLTAFAHYIDKAPAMLQSELVPTSASKSYISFEPLGIIFSVMPWNFPFWQVFRFAVPALLAGNVTILKHAPSVPQCAAAMEAAFAEAGIMDGVFKNYYLTNEDAAQLIAHPDIAGVSFTGSDTTGSIIASLAGQHIKKSVVELGGNDPFIVLADANVKMAVAGAIKSRSINSGQSCNAAKRFIVSDKVYDLFVTELIKAVKDLKVGDPMKEGTQIGPLARKDLAQKVAVQIRDTVASAATPHYHPYLVAADSNFVAPVVLEGVLPGMRAFEEEIFGPVWSVTKATTTEAAVTLANQSQYGLGASIWTADMNAAARLIPLLQTGNVFINEIVKSDAKLPFGGIKRSGYGRELSEYGLMEFVNIKTVFIH